MNESGFEIASQSNNGIFEVESIDKGIQFINEYLDYYEYSDIGSEFNGYQKSQRGSQYSRNKSLKSKKALLSRPEMKIELIIKIQK